MSLRTVHLPRPSRTIGVSNSNAFPKVRLKCASPTTTTRSAAIVRFGERGALAASALVFTMNGVPLLYNGQEVGDTTESTAPALFENLQVFWGISERRSQYPKFYKQIIALRRAHPALQQGETEWLRTSAPDRVLAYMRRAGGEEFLVIVNTSNKPFTGVIDAPSGTYTDVTPVLDQRPVSLPAVSLDAFGFRIYQKTR